MNSWRRVRLVDLCEAHVDCVNRTAPVIDEPTPFKMIRTSNVGGGFIDTENVKYVTEETYLRWTRRLVPRRGDVVLTREAPLGEVGKVRTDERIFLGQRLYHFRADPKLADSDFLMYSLMGPDLQAQIRSFGSGSTVEHMRLPDIEKLELAAPVVEEQRRIAGILSAYDELIENCERRIRVLDEMARTLYREWFVLFRYPGHDKTPLVESPLGRIPKDWAVGFFTDFADVLSGGTPKTDVAEFWNGEIPFFTPRDAPSCFYVRDTEKHLSPRGLSNCASELYPPDTVFITARGTVGKVALPAVPMAMNQSCYALRARGRTSQRFLFLLTLQQVDYLKRNTGGATFATIVVDTFRRMQVILPPTVLIDEFTRVVDPMFDTIRNLDARAANLRLTRDLLLPRLLSGQLSLADAA